MLVTSAVLFGKIISFRQNRFDRHRRQNIRESEPRKSTRNEGEFLVFILTEWSI